MTTIEPTYTGRIAALDVLRGVAILGILLANIAYFAYPMSEWMMGVSTEPLTGTDATIAGLTLAFVSAKFRSMLAILFGVGLYLQYRKRSQVEGNWPGGYLKRMAWLAVIGLVHGLLMWFGDILFLYSIIGFVACFFAAANERVMRWMIGLGAAGAVVIGFGLMGLFVALGNFPEEGNGGGTAMMGLLTAEQELAVFGSGTYLDQLRARAVQFAFYSISMLFLAPLILPLFLLGIGFGRSGALAKPSAQPKTRAWMLGIGLGLGLPLNMLALGLGGSEHLMAISLCWEITLGPILALGYLMALAMWVESGRLAWLQKPLAQVGRVAMTCYLMQTVLCTFVFYSWGLRLFGQLTMPQTYIVVAGVWAANLVFAHLWLRRFSIGPVEWVWRSLTEGRRVPWRVKPTLVAEDGGR